MSSSELTHRVISGNLVTFLNGVQINSVSLPGGTGIRRIGGLQHGTTYGPIHVKNPETREYVLIDSSAPLIESPDPSELPIPKIVSFDVGEERQDDGEEIGSSKRG